MNQKGRTKSGTSLFVLIYGVSGFAVLVFETAWIRALGIQLGNSAISAALILCVFFLAAAFGNGLGSRLASSVRRPLLWYGATEIAFGSVGLLLYTVRHALWALPCVPPGWPGAIACAALLAGGPSLLAGVTFPLISEGLVGEAGRRTRIGGRLYAGNLAGAALGVAGGLALPLCIGYRMTVAAAAGACLLAGLTAVGLGGRARPLPREADAAADTPAPRAPPALGHVLFAASGALTLGLEILMVHYFRLFQAGSVYSLSAVLFAFILGLGAGAGLASALRRRLAPEPLLTAFLWSSAVGLAAGPLILHGVLAGGWLTPAAGSLWGLSLATGIKTTVLLLPVVTCLGAVFPLAWELVARHAAHQGRPLGMAMALNKAGCALGVVLVPFVLLPRAGLPAAVWTLGAGYAVLALALDASRKRLSALRLAPLGAMGAAFVLLRAPVAPAPGESVRAVYQGAGGLVCVTEDAAGSRHIVIDNVYTLNGTARALRSQRHQGWIPLFLREQTRRVAYVGMASGISAAAALDFPIDTLDAVEVVPEVVQAARDHFAPWNARLFTDPRSRVIADDGRRVVATATRRFDLVICDLFMPAQDGTASLYSRDFFATVAEKLTDDGWFCLWLPSYQLDAELTGMIFRTVLDVFPHAVLIRGNFDPIQPVVGVIASGRPLDWTSDLLSRRIRSEAVRKLAVESPFFRSEANARLLLIGDLRAAAPDFRACPLTTDDHPVFLFRGPKPLAPGTALRGFPFLDFYGTRFLNNRFPSFAADPAPSSDPLGGIRAGNHYFAAAVAGVPLPSEAPGRQVARTRQALGYLRRAKEFSPASELGPDDLGR